MTTTVKAPVWAGAWGTDEDAAPVDPTSLNSLGHITATSPDELDHRVAAAHAALRRGRRIIVIVRR